MVMGRLIMIGMCIRLLSNLAYKWDIVRDVEERWNPKLGVYEIVRILPRGERLTNVQKVDQNRPVYNDLSHQ